MAAGTRGQPSLQDWERIRVMAWVREIERLAQAKMELPSLPKNDPFRLVRINISKRWQQIHRPKAHLNRISMGDLTEVFCGTYTTTNAKTQKQSQSSTRTDFNAYRRGQQGRPKDMVIHSVGAALPSALEFYQVGPNGVPLWAAIRNEYTTTQFWIHLLQSGQINDLLTQNSDLFDSVVELMCINAQLATPRKPGDNLHTEKKQVQDKMENVINSEIREISAMSWASCIITHLFPDHFPSGERQIDLTKIDATRLNLGIVLLAIYAGNKAIACQEELAIQINGLKEILKIMCSHMRDLDPTFELQEEFPELDTLYRQASEIIGIVEGAIASVEPDEYPDEDMVWIPPQRQASSGDVRQRMWPKFRKR